MKKTKQYKICNRVFRLDDLKRIVQIFDGQKKLAVKSSHHFTVSYNIYFSDGSSIEADNANILEDNFIQIKKPVEIELRFSNYDLNREMKFFITHGTSDYNNKFIISAKNDSWTNDIYAKILDCVNGSKPQPQWINKYSFLIYHLVAIGLGSLGMLIIGFLISFMPPDINVGESTQQKAELVVAFVLEFKTVFYILGWIGRWIMGFTWGAIPITIWLLSSWPNIELDLGAGHLKKEKNRRNNLLLLLTIIIIPIGLTILLN
jgi:hypothetical protein